MSMWPDTVEILRGRHLGKHNEASAAVVHPAFFGLLETSRGFFAIADRDQTIRIDALADQEVFRHLGAFGAEGEVVFGGTEVITVAFNFDAGFGISFQPFGILH